MTVPRWATIIGRGNGAESMEMEIDFDHHLHGDGMALVHGRPKPVLAHSFNGFLVQAHAEGSGYANVLGVALLVHDELDCDSAFVVCLARFFGEFGLDGVYDLRRTDTAAHAHESAAVAAAAAWTGACAVTETESAAQTMAKSGTAAGALRGQHDLGRIRGSQMHGRITIRDLHLHCGLDGEFWALEPGELRSEHLHLSYLGGIAFCGWNNLVGSTATATTGSFGNRHHFRRRRRSVEREV